MKNVIHTIMPYVFSMFLIIKYYKKRGVQFLLGVVMMIGLILDLVCSGFPQLENNVVFNAIFICVVIGWWVLLIWTSIIWIKTEFLRKNKIS